MAAPGRPPWHIAAPHFKTPTRSSPPNLGPAGIGPTFYNTGYGLGPGGLGSPLPSSRAPVRGDYPDTYKPIVRAAPQSLAGSLTSALAGPASPYPGYLTPAQILAQATASINAAYDPQIAAYQGFISDAQAASNAKIALLRSLLESASSSLAGLPAEAQQAWRNAATDQGAIAQGFSSGLADTLQGQADKTNALLSAIGAPSGQDIPGSQSQQVGDVAYGLGGYLPAATMEGQGLRAFEQAQQIPQQIWQQGLGVISGYQADETALEAQYRQQIATIAAQKPADLQKAVADINAQQADLLKQAKDDAYKQQQIRLETSKVLQGIANDRTKAFGVLWVVTKDGQIKQATGRNGKPIVTLAGAKSGGLEHVVINGQAYAFDARTGIYYDPAGRPVVPAGPTQKLIVTGDGKAGWTLSDPVTGQVVRRIPPGPNYQKMPNGDLVQLIPGRKPIVLGNYADPTKIAQIKLSAARLKAQVIRDNRMAEYRQVQTQIKLADQRSKQDGTVWYVGPKGPQQLLDDKGRPVPTITTTIADQKATQAQRNATLAWVRLYGVDPKTGLLTLDGQKAIEDATGYMVDRKGNVVTDTKTGKPVLTAKEADKQAAIAAQQPNTKTSVRSLPDGRLGIVRISPNGTVKIVPIGPVPTGNNGSKIVIRDPTTGVPLTNTQIRAEGQNVLDTIKNYRAHGYQLEQLIQTLREHGSPPDIWMPIVMRAYKIPRSLKDLKFMSLPRLHNLAVFMGYQPDATHMLDKPGLISWIQANSGKADAAAEPADARRAPGGQYLPVPTAFPAGSEFATVDAEGAPDASGVTHHAALDWMAPAGTAVASPIGGTIVEVRLANGDYSGQVFGGTVKVQGANGRVWVFRHVDPHSVSVGQKVKAGQQIASVANWTDSPGSTHTHIELWKTLGGGYRYENMIDPFSVFAKGQIPVQTQPAETPPQRSADMRMALRPAGARQVARRMAILHGWSDKQWRDLNVLINSESGWNYRAWHNPATGRPDTWRGNAPPPRGAFGIGQALGHELPPDYATNPIVQIQWLFDYIRDRYDDDPSVALQFKLDHGGIKKGWY